MPGKKLNKIVSDIKALKIQGAGNVRIAVVEAIRREAWESRANTAAQLRNEIKQGMILFLNSRATEPEMRTALRVILRAVQFKTDSVDELKQKIANTCNNYESDRKKALEKIAEFGSGIIPKGAVVFTHCHSNTVEEILKRAWKEKKLKGVICTETRPKLQGHITAENLAKSGIPVTIIADSAAYPMMHGADLLLTGADAILANGDVVNKIGTAQISLAAAKENVPHYVACSSHKFDPLTTFGEQEIIEERDPKEIWEKKMKHLKIRNPAFDITRASFVKEIICELGCLAPASFAAIVYERLGLDRHSEADFSIIKLFRK